MSLAAQYLDQRFTGASVQHPALPFFHSCEAKFLQSILDSRELQPRPCKVYGENLLYLFYGKPAYKSGEISHSSLSFMMPMCFIINYEAVCDVKRIVAFDSGAFPMYKDHFHESMTTKEFELTPSKSVLKKMIGYFYTGNESYFNGKPKQELVYDPIHFQIEGYHSLIKTQNKAEIDDRKASLEVQVTAAIPLNSFAIEAIILPASLAKSPMVKEIIINDLKIPIIEILNYGVVSNNYYGLVLDKARDHLVKKGVLNGCE